MCKLAWLDSSFQVAAALEGDYVDNKTSFLIRNKRLEHITHICADQSGLRAFGTSTSAMIERASRDP
jgi:hypothetical protein